MKILAIESSGMTAGAAILEDDQIVAEYGITHKKTHSQTLLPMIDEICRMAEVDRASLSAVAVSAGPGSFTGLRIGSATAKGIGLALSIPVIPVPTMAGLAYNVCGQDGLVCPIADARRGTVYTGLYRFHGMKMETVEEQQVLDMDEWLLRLLEYGEPIRFLGDAVGMHAERIREIMKENGLFVPVHQNLPRAASVAALGAVLLLEGKAESAAAHAPIYLRLTQAERERLERENGKHD